MTMDWDQIAQEEVPEEKGSFEDLPPGVWLIATTPTDPQSNWLIKSRAFDWTDDRGETHTSHSIEGGFRVLGGEASLEENQRNRYLGFSVGIRPRTDKDEKGILAPRLKHLLNTLFAPGVGAGIVVPKGAKREEKEALEKQRVQARLNVTLATLRAAAEAHGLKLEDFEGDMPLFLAGCAVVALENQPRLLITKGALGKPDKNKVRRVKAQSFEDLTQPNMTKLKVSFFDPADAGEALAEYEAPAF